MLNGVARLAAAYGDLLKDDIFKEKVGSCSIKEIGRTARERQVGSLGYAETFLIQYNKKMKHPLPWASLYSGKGRKPSYYLTQPDADRYDDVDIPAESDPT